MALNQLTYQAPLHELLSDYINSCFSLNLLFYLYQYGQIAILLRVKPVTDICFDAHFVPYQTISCFFSSFCVLLTCPHQSLGTSMFPATKCLQVILYLPCPRPGISCLSKEESSLKTNRHAHCYSGFSPPKSNKSK